MIGNALIVIGVCSALLVLGDFFMSEEQRKGALDAVIRGWNWLDDVKGVPRFDLLKRPEIQLWSALIVTFVVAIFPWIGPPGFLPNAAKSIPVCMLFGFLAYQILKFSARANSSGKAFLRGLPLVIVLELLVWIYLVATAKQYTGDAIEYILEVYWSIYLLITPLIILLLVVFAPQIIIFSTPYALSAAEFVTRRLAENRKGPLLAASAALAALGEVIKQF